MADTGDADYGTVYYRSKDNIKNLRVKVHIERVTSTSVVPQAVIEKNITSTSKGKPLSSRDIRREQELLSQKESETLSFSWQEKVFSQREFELYQDELNCEDVIQKKYHEDIKKLGKRQTSRLFSYVNHDRSSFQTQSLKSVTTSPNEKPNGLSVNVANVRRRRVATRVGDSEAMTPKYNLINMNPSKESRQRNLAIDTPEQTYMIMADLSPKDRLVTEDDEYILCVIKVDANGVITMKPNFSKDRPYKIEADRLGKEAFQYTLENTSMEMTHTEKQRELKMYKELYNRHSQYLQGLVGSQFEMPPLGVLRLCLYGEIVSARNFEYNNLFIRYIIDMPSEDKGWKVDHSKPLAGVTQTCSTTTIERDEVAYFSFPFETEMFYRKPMGNENDEAPPAWPRVYFEVCSLDSWSRYRTEGYAAFTIPSFAGQHEVSLNCWRPKGPSVVSNLRRFFIGGSPELEDLSYAHIPSTFQGSRLSRFGFRTETTGELKIKFNIMFQSESFCDAKMKKKQIQRDMLMTQLGSAVDYTQIRAIIDAFSRAHDKMRKARDNALADLKEFGMNDRLADDIS